jgi:hypothetical protein
MLAKCSCAAGGSAPRRSRVGSCLARPVATGIADNLADVRQRAMSCIKRTPSLNAADWLLYLHWLQYGDGPGAEPGCPQICSLLTVAVTA